MSICNQALDDMTTRFGHALLAEAGGDRKASLFRRFFSLIPSELIRQGLRKQCEYTRDTMIGELKKLPDGSPLRAYLPRLEERVARAMDALDGRSKVRAERASVGVLLPKRQGAVAGGRAGPAERDGRLIEGRNP